MVFTVSGSQMLSHCSYQILDRKGELILSVLWTFKYPTLLFGGLCKYMTWGGNLCCGTRLDLKFKCDAAIERLQLAVFFIAKFGSVPQLTPHSSHGVTRAVSTPQITPQSKLTCYRREILLGTAMKMWAMFVDSNFR